MNKDKLAADKDLIQTIRIRDLEAEIKELKEKHKKYLDNALKAQREACAKSYALAYQHCQPFTGYDECREAILNARIEE